MFGNLESTKKSILQEIEVLDYQDNDSGDLLGRVRLKRTELANRVKETDKKLESLKRQKTEERGLMH